MYNSTSYYDTQLVHTAKLNCTVLSPSILYRVTNYAVMWKKVYFFSINDEPFCRDPAEPEIYLFM